MDDYMDSLVKKVEGNMKPIRAEKLEEDYGAEAGSTPAKAESKGEENKDIFLHVHRENVKCYRNTQAVINDSTGSIKTELGKGQAGIRGLLTVILILLLLNLGAGIVLILHTIFGLL